MPRERRYTDEQLVAAVATANSWRGALRGLGLSGTSAGAMRSVRARADLLGLDYRHFTGQRSWTESELRSAVAGAATWADVVERLGLRGGSGVATVRGHAVRLGLDTTHLTVPDTESRSGMEARRPDVSRLDRAGSLLAAAWFTLCGDDVSWPLEPARYDLLVMTKTGTRRVQVKTTTVRAGATWKVYLSTSGRGRRTYDPDEIDDFFVIDGDLTQYLIPASAVGGLQAIHVGAYEGYRVPALALPRPSTPTSTCGAPRPSGRGDG
ncbi:hypothetical protein ACFQ8T_05715 [Isoptericola sp. NPDC056618]|uniref:hypothetical protein n=1 Tax=Isoptericola sp. NPDC056618 TaxID=3345878 RepID=UPI003682CF47